MESASGREMGDKQLGSPNTKITERSADLDGQEDFERGDI
jgi:hypothetical protein